MACGYTRLTVIAYVCLFKIAASLIVRKDVKDPVPLTPSRQVPADSILKVQHNSTSAQQAGADQNLQQCLHDKRVVFIGPSTSKADYLALTYFAEYGQWPSQDLIWYGNPKSAAPLASGPNVLYGPVLEYATGVGGQRIPGAANGCTVGTTESYLWYSNSIFNGHELCDCYKNDPKGQFHIADIYNQTENRIYSNGKTMIAYFQWFGDTVLPRGSVNLSPLTYMPMYLDPIHAVKQQCPAGQFKGSWDWSMPVPQLMNNFIRNVKPTHIIVDAAYWPTDPNNLAFWNELSTAGSNAVYDSKGQVLWRVVPMRHDYPIGEHSSQVNMQPFFSKGWKVFDARGTVQQYRGAKADGEIFFDQTHLKPQVESYLMSSFLQSHVCAYG